MGYELNRLMTQMGVASPTLSSTPYSNTEEAAAAQANYRQDYLNRVANTPQYLQAQFQTAPSYLVQNPDVLRAYQSNPLSMTPEAFAQTHYRAHGEREQRALPPDMSAGRVAAMAPGGAGLESLNQQIRTFMANQPDDAQVRNFMGRHNLTQRDLYNATGNYWGNVLQAPTLANSLSGQTTVRPPTLTQLQAQAYARANPDVQRAFDNRATLPGLESFRNATLPELVQAHYNKYGQYEARMNPATGRMETAPNLDQLVRTYVADVTASQPNAAQNAAFQQGLNTLIGGVMNPSQAQAYFAANPDVAQAYANRATTPGLETTVGLSPEQFAETHYTLFGRGEQRAIPSGQAASPTYYEAPAPAPAAPASYFDRYPDVAAAYQANTYGLTPEQFAQTHYERFGQGEGRTFARGGGVHALARKYAEGGSVRKFSRGGSEGEPDDGRREFETELSLGSDVPARVMPRGVMMVNGAEPAAPMSPTQMGMERPTPQQIEREVTASPAAQPVVPPASAPTPVSPAAIDLMGMLQRLSTEGSSYGPELRAARERATKESERFEQMLMSMAQQQRPAPDKAELYFRLAAAFGSPTKTGHFAESLGAVGREMGAYQQEQRKTAREDEALRRQLGLEIAKSRVGAAREDVASLRGLAGEEMKDRRALLMEYLRSGRPQSDAGKAALDKGLKQGTPEFAQFVDRYIDDKIRTGNLFKEAMVTISQGNLQVAQAGLGIKQEEAARKTVEAQRLSPPELRLRSETEDALRTAESAARDLRRALEINPNTFDTTIMDATRRTLLEQSGSKDPKIANTREQENLLKSAMISSAAEKMKGVLSDSDIKLLQSVAGLDSKSIEVRRRILENAVKSLENAQQAQKKRLNDIVAGRYRMTTPSDGEQ